MDPIRKGIVQLADEASFLVQHVCQTFGFLPDGRELVKVSESNAGLTAAFLDRSDEGWLGFTLNLPADASFSHATIGILSRSAFWWVRLSPKAVVNHLSTHNDGFPARGLDSGRGGSFSLENHVKVQVGGTRNGVSLLVVTQTRDPDSIRDTIRARSSSFRERWG
jgi:hypothetical protein